MLKKVSKLFLIMILIISTSFSSFAQGAGEVRLEFMPSVENYESVGESQNETSSRVPNLIPITVTARANGTGCDVHVGNLGVDGLDSVNVKLTATGYSTSKSYTYYVPPVIGKTFRFDFPMIKANTKYKASIRITDGGQTTWKNGEATLKYSETYLTGIWNKGTFSSRGASLEYHLKKHGHEVDSNNLVDYLNKAAQYRSEVLADIEKGDLSDYKVTIGTGSIPSKKYKNIKDGRYIILADSNQEIFSFGI
ncbi:MAG: hypothetical protein MJA82_21600 [Clostridia bacterium]|nr:hypothetical protein [Clostridia bacterium]